MKITDLLSSKTIVLNAKAKDKNEIIKKAIATIKNSGAIKNINEYSKLVYAREKKSTTGVGDGIAIPHAKSKVVKKPALAALVIRDGVDYAALDGEKVNLLFLIAAPESKDNVHLDVLARLSNLLMHPEFKESLLKAKTATEFMKAIDSSEELFLGAQSPAKKTLSNGYDYLAVTACPTGIAHTFMAEEALKKAAEKMHISIKVETNGQAGVKNKLTDEEIANAKGIIVAADTAVETTRFNGKKVITTAVSRAIKEAEVLLKQVDDAPVYKKSGFIKSKEERTAQEGKFHTIYKHLMNGVSHMIPLVVGGGILIAIAFLIDMACGVTPGPDFGTVTIGARIFKTIGGFAFNLMLPILAGFIAFSISGRPGLVIGLAGGVAASSGGFNLLYWIGDEATKAKLEGVNAGFLGAIIAGFLAGYVVKLLERATVKVPKSLDGLRPILIYPLFGILIIGLVMFLVNIPLSHVNIGLNEGLTKLNEMKLDILLGALVAMMMATDMGGPINKAAYVFATGLLAQSSADINHQHIMAAVMLGGMVPPLAIALSAALFPQKYSKDDRRNAPVTAVMGAGFITEGVIPYAAKDPWRVILSCMIGSAAGGALAVYWDCKLPAPHGGVFVFPVMAQSAGFYVLAIIIGTVISTIMLGILKKDVNEELGKWKGISFRRVGQKIAGVFTKNKKSQ
ncbi:MAG: fructose-specific PTS transporter subunit EIIC [Bacilli bacterium]|nr:fructose-specific PTS transporter subunit EIIC [Bacilli bacterium]